MPMDLDDIEITGIENYPVTSSLAYHGPPGTGKTSKSAARVGTLIRDHGYEMSDVTWVTYRRSLARDTLTRLAEWDVLDPAELENPSEGATRYIGTAHAVANRCASIGEAVVEPWHRGDFCEKRDMPYWTSQPWEDSAGKLLFRVLDYLANANTTPKDKAAVRECPHIDDLREHWQGDLLDAWYDWEDYKAQYNIIDFHEMLKRPLEEGDSPGRPILVVDEYHDVTELMDELFRSWMDEAEIVIAAGDPHQVVNAYDGASPSYFENLDLPTVLLDTTYRVPEEHWALATRMLSDAHTPPTVRRDSRGLVNDINSPLFEHSDENGWVRVPGREEQGSPGWVVDRHGRESTLFLTRTRMQADGIGAALEAAGIPYRSQPELHGWNTEETDIRLAVHNALQKIEGYSPTNFGYGGNKAFSAYTGNNKNPTDVSLQNTEAAGLLEATSAHDLEDTRSDVNDLVDELRDDEEGELTLREFDEHVTKSFWERYTAGANSVSRLNKGPFGTGSSADREIRALKAALNRQEGPISPDSINCHAITIHASKGMEADDVVVYDGVSNRILREIQSNDESRRNEYRTWYVALSRAKKRLHVMRDAFAWTNSIIPTDLQSAAQEAYEQGHVQGDLPGGGSA
ncbi:3'-5' exonuclease [Natrinema sp. 1APR25-10V2]|uniref:3'-5' exonuclease n=1 Tax=Natrinema sp. 1APR25-10V2 TaxID=2951081 RepID=UPI0028763304|nr:3'-5' exonuclease [Natrinema sp. 1APR25-10V2]MDS0478666.1 AAA family ATPase [Natrinema sp. 1APR25-10V2]